MTNPYIEKRNKCIAKNTIFVSNGYRDEAPSIRININKAERTMELLRKKRPIADVSLSHAHLEGKFASKKEFDKLIKATIPLTDFDFISDLITTNKLDTFVFKIGVDKAINIFNILSKPRKFTIERRINNEDGTNRTIREEREQIMSTHNFLSNVPQKLKYPELVGDYFYRILSYSLSEEDVFKLMQLCNYRRILDAPNKNKLLEERDYILTHRTLSVTGDSAAESYMILNNYKGDSFISYTKNSSIITSIGSATMCCFRKGGVGEPLMMVSLKSPITGILHGVNYNESRWFAYVWEMVEYNSELKTFEINLVLDNIEASSRLSLEDYKAIEMELSNFGGYSKIYLGYLRNDIVIPESVKSTIKEKPYHIPYYANEVRRYGSYDDSKDIYTMLSRDTNTIIENHEKKSIDLGEINRLMYIMKDIYEEDNSIIEKDEEHSFFDYKRLNAKFNLNKLIDLDKSYIVRNEYSISEFALYDNEGNIIAKTK